MNIHIRHAALAFFLASVTASALLVACDSDSGAVKEQPTPVGEGGPITPTQDGSVITPMQDGGGDSAPTDCVQNPQTHEEIINGCTTATRITKNPTLPLLLPDGGLPPIM